MEANKIDWQKLYNDIWNSFDILNGVEIPQDTVEHKKFNQLFDNKTVLIENTKKFLMEIETSVDTYLKDHLQIDSLNDNQLKIFDLKEDILKYQTMNDGLDIPKLKHLLKLVGKGMRIEVINELNLKLNDFKEYFLVVEYDDDDSYYLINESTGKKANLVSKERIAFFLEALLYEYITLNKIYNEVCEFYEQKLNILENVVPRGKKEITKELITKIDNIYSKINQIEIKRIEHYRERILQNLLGKFPQIIESGLNYLQEEYKLGDTNYRGDLLFLDLNKTKLNVELKVVVPRFKDFSRQLTNYMNNIENDERLMYIAPKITEEQEKFCESNKIEYKIINLNSTLNWY